VSRPPDALATLYLIYDRCAGELCRECAHLRLDERKRPAVWRCKKAPPTARWDPQFGACGLFAQRGRQ